MRDLHFAVRQLLRYRGFAATAILIPALGIAASIALFGFVDAAMIKPLPYAEPSRLVSVFGTLPGLARGGGVSYLDFRDWRERAHSLSALAAFDVRAGFTLVGTAERERVPGLRVSSGFFRTLGVTPLVGREFAPDEEGPAAPPTAMISFAAWQARFGGSSNVIGQTVALESSWLGEAEPHVIIGVLPADFQFAMAEHAEFWTTIRKSQVCWGVRSCRSLQVVGRLATGASPETATAEMTSIIEQLRREYPAAYRDAEVANLVPLREIMLGDVRRVLLMLLAGALLLLVIACTNVMSLVLARTDSRAREIAIRNALGASAARLVSQFATEAMVLAGTAAITGAALAMIGMQFLSSLLTADMVSRMPYLQGLGFNVRLALFAGAVTMIVALVFALTPLARISVSGTLGGLADTARGTGNRMWRRVGAPLVVAELALAIVLLVGAGLLGKSLYRLTHVDVGFNTDNLASMSVSLASGTSARAIADRVAALPGVQSVSYADLLPLSAGLAPASSFWVVGRPEENQLKGGWPVRRISANHFATLHAPLLRGRTFTEDEIAQTRLVMIINESAARRCFPNQDPIGQSIAFGSASSPKREIVGIVADVKDGPPETPPHPSAYVPFDQSAFALAIRFSQAAHSQSAAIRTAILEIRPDAQVGPLTTMSERVNRLPSTAMHRSTAWLTGSFAVLALLLSVVGLYGVVAYSVGQRTREIGVRMALGAQRQTVYRLVLGEAAWLACLGTSVGTIAAVLAARTMGSFLFNVSSSDPLTLVAAACALVCSALLASYVPARRAASVNPIEVLRTDG
jgi:predicted permease